MQIPCHSPTSSSSRRTVHFAQADSIFPLSSGNEAASLPNATPPSTSSTFPAQLPLPTPVNIIEPPFSQLEAWMLDSPFCDSIDLGPLEFSSPHLPWIFKVYPRSGAQVITLGDVLKALYGGLRQPATSQEIEDFCHNFGNAIREALFESREHRAKLGEEQPLVIRRVDFLTGHRWLVGFSASASTKNHWHFHTMERAV